MPLTAEINFQQIKRDYHKRVLERLNLEHLDRMPAETARQEVVGLIRSMLALESVPLSLAERDLLDEIFGFGPLETFLRDPLVSDILVNRADQIYVEKKGRLQKTPVTFQDDAHLLRIIDRIVSRVGRRVDESSPMVDARLPDGSRVNAIIPPLALDGPCLSIRRFGSEPLTGAKLLEHKALTEALLSFLECC